MNEIAARPDVKETGCSTCLFKENNNGVNPDLFFRGSLIPLRLTTGETSNRHIFDSLFSLKSNSSAITDASEICKKYLRRVIRHASPRQQIQNRWPNKAILALFWRQQCAWRVDFCALPINHHRLFCFVFSLDFLSPPNFGRINKQIQLLRSAALYIYIYIFHRDADSPIDSDVPVKSWSIGSFPVGQIVQKTFLCFFFRCIIIGGERQRGETDLFILFFLNFCVESTSSRRGAHTPLVKRGSRLPFGRVCCDETTASKRPKKGLPIGCAIWFRLAMISNWFAAESKHRGSISRNEIHL